MSRIIVQLPLKPLGKWMRAARMPRFLKRCGALRKGSLGKSQQEELGSDSEVRSTSLLGHTSERPVIAFTQIFTSPFVSEGWRCFSLAREFTLKPSCRWLDGISFAKLACTCAFPNKLLLEQGEEMDWKDPCTVCGRRYYHEHVRSISKGNVHCEDADPDDM